MHRNFGLSPIIDDKYMPWRVYLSSEYRANTIVGKSISIQKKRLRKIVSVFVALEGFEPSQAEPESDVLPLHHKARCHVVLTLQRYALFSNRQIFFYYFFEKKLEPPAINAHNRIDYRRLISYILSKIISINAYTDVCVHQAAASCDTSL